MGLKENLDRVVKRHEDLAAALAGQVKPDSREYVKMSKEYADLMAVVEAIRTLQAAEQELAGLASILEDDQGEVEIHSLAEEESQALKEQIIDLKEELQVLLLPKDEVDAKNAILEVRAGTGGEEAALFAADLFRMYQRYAEHLGWKTELLGITETGLGGYKEAGALISGHNVFARLKFESGVHRVQRIPETESGGRIHTSAATVAVLPEAEEVDVEVNDKDLRIDVFRSSGPGGQSVNTTDSAVRITHVPTGIVVQQQDEKSQHKNRAKAMKVLLARLYDRKRNELEEERAATRRGQVGSGDRSERIRTYNFPQGRVTDHRIRLTLHKLDKVLSGEGLDEIIAALIAEDQASRLTELT